MVKGKETKLHRVVAALTLTLMLQDWTTVNAAEMKL
jgi:hypothetical protein